MGEDIDVDHTCLPPQIYIVYSEGHIFVGTIPWEGIEKLKEALF